MNKFKTVIAELQLILTLHAANPRDRRIKRLLKDAEADFRAALAEASGGQDSTLGDDQPH